MAQRPSAIGLMLCEQVIYEGETNNITTVNRFTRLFVDGFPVTLAQFRAFALLTDGQGDMRLALAIHRPDTLEEIYQVETPLHMTNQLEEVRCRIWVRGCTFPIEGSYHVSLLVDDESIASCRLTLIQREPS